MLPPFIIAETDDLLILSKPSGYHSVAQTISSSNDPAVETWIREKFENSRGLPEAGLLHRLDQPTTGCLVAAKTSKAYEIWKKKFQSGESIKKYYLALVRKGLSEKGEFELFFSSRYRGSKKVSVSRAGKAQERGRTLWQIMQSSENFDLIQAQILGSGRRHQIRAGFAFLGYPLAGDVFYGGEQWSAFGLHAWRLVIDGVSYECPLPAEWKTQSGLEIEDVGK